LRKKRTNGWMVSPPDWILLALWTVMANTPLAWPVYDLFSIQYMKKRRLMTYWYPFLLKRTFQHQMQIHLDNTSLVPR
jgi:hypothetical protein